MGPDSGGSGNEFEVVHVHVFVMEGDLKMQGE